EARIARDDKEASELRQGSDDVFGDAVAKVLLLGIAAHVLKRKDCNGQLVGGSGPVRHRQWFEPQTKGTDRPCNVPQGLLTDILEGEVYLPRDILLHARRDANPASLGDAFEPCGDVDPVAENVPVLLDDISDIDPDPESD